MRLQNHWLGAVVWMKRADGGDALLGERVSDWRAGTRDEVGVAESAGAVVEKTGECQLETSRYVCLCLSACLFVCLSIGGLATYRSGLAASTAR